MLAGCATHPTDPQVIRIAESAPRVASAAVPIPVLTTLADTQWFVVELAGQPVEPAVSGWAMQSLEFDPDGQRATGHGGVNRFGGRYKEVGQTLSFGPLAMTRRAGPPAQMTLESRYTQALSRVSGWRQEGLQVVLIGTSGERAVVLAPAPARASE